MNNTGASLIRAGRYNEALAVLGNALMQVQKYLQDDSNSSSADCAEVRQEGQLTRDDDDTLEKAVAQRLDRKNGEGGAFSIDSDENNQSSEGSFVYRKPIEVTFRDDDSYTFSIFLIFNMALTHHLIAIEEKNSKRRLKGALKLYELSYSMQMKGNVRLGITETLALVNNCAQIHKELKKESKARRFFQHLLSSLMMMIDSGYSEQIDQLDGFFANASQLILRDPCFASAA